MKRIIGYVNTADLNHMREEDVRALTVINIAFGLIRDGEVVWDAKDARDGIVSIRKSNPELKIVLSVGGWGADGFSQAARTKEGRERFAASALAIVKEYGLDGIDIDWEYPGTSLAGIASDRSDKENYTLLLAELRKTLDAYREGMLVTTAVGGDVYFALQTDMKEASRSDIKAMTAEIQKIGVNINQIAKRVNATGSVYQEDIEEIKGVLAEIWRLQRLSLLKAR